MTRLIFVAYLLLLTAALLAPNPFGIAGGRENVLRAVYDATVEPVVHLLAFLPLGYLGMACRWPTRHIFCLALLATYAAATEGGQALLPTRLADWGDLGQNLAGLAVGAGLWWLTCGDRRSTVLESKL